MLHHFRPIRTKLSLLYLVVFGVIMALLSMGVLKVREHDLLETLDERIRDRATTLVEAMAIEGDSSIANDRLFHAAGYYFQLRREDGTTIEKSANLAEQELLFSSKTTRACFSGRSVLETQALEGGEPLRVLTLYDKDAGLYLQVASSLVPLRTSIAELRGIFFVAVVLGLLMAAAASWFLAGRSLAPVTRIVRQARDISASRLDRRIEVPPWGDEISELVLTVNSMLDRLEQSFRAQERFIANASHELRTPISVLLGEAQVLRQQVRSTEEYDRFVTSVQDEMKGLAQVINGLLMLARAQAGLPVSSETVVSVNDVVTEAVKRCQPLARQREVPVVTRLALPDPQQPEALVKGDAELLGTLVGNMLRNAIRFSRVDVPVAVEIGLDATEVAISVRDRGPGIPTEDVERIFDEFYSVQHSNDTFKGIGLGLAIVKGVAEIHGGRIAVRNLDDGGCEFTVKLPLALNSSRPQDPGQIKEIS